MLPSVVMTTPGPGSRVMDNLCDALARGRLCLAELALLDPPELEAMYGVGIGRIDTGRVDEAITILAALVALYAYSAKYWRGLGLALHLGRRLEAAMWAYQLALHLEPDHVLTTCYLGELKLFCGKPDEAYLLLEHAAQSNHRVASARAKQLLVMPVAPPLPDMPPPPPPPLYTSGIDTFELTGGGPLPMPHAGTQTPTQTFPGAHEVTNKIFLADDATDVGDVTQTAVIQRPGRPGALAHEGSATGTGVVDRAGALDTAQPGDALWDFMRWFASAARRRRDRTSLLHDETSPGGPKAGGT